MRYHQLGTSDLQVSEIAMGCMSLENDVNASYKLIHQALDYGINFFDTADLYDHGHNEELLGFSLQNKRDQVVIATKVGNQWNTDKTTWRWNPSKTYILAAVDESLKRLKTDYIDLYQLHGGTIDDPIDETIEAFELLKEKGKIRHYGISSIRPNVIREYVQRSNISSVMMQYSMLDRRPEESCLALLAEHDVSVITRGTLAKGLLAGKPVQPYLNHSPEAVEQAAQQLQYVAKNQQQSYAFTACQYVLQHDAVSAAVVGFRTTEQLSNCLESYSENQLNMHDLRLLADATAAYCYENHR
ncbi:MAG: aldo/keto reductase [Flammeovirgaceae bacterium]